MENETKTWLSEQEDKFKIEIYKGFLELILSGKCAFAVPENSVYHVKDFDLSNNIEDVEIISDTYISIDDVIKQYNEYLPLTDKDGE